MFHLKLYKFSQLQIKKGGEKENLFHRNLVLLEATNVSSGKKRILCMIFPLPPNLNPVCIYFHDFRDKIGDNYVNPLLNSKAEKSIKYSFGFAPSKWNTPVYFFLSGRQKFLRTIILFFFRWHENNFGKHFAPNI